MSVRRRTAIVLTAALGLAAMALPASGQPPNGIVTPSSRADRSALDRGAELYAANCSSCHGVDGRGIASPRPGAGGIEGAGPDLRHAGALAADFYLRTGRMPIGRPGEEPERSRPYFSDSDTRALVRYVASLGNGPRIPQPHPDGANVSAGQQLFASHCAGCHQIAGQGGYVTGARVPALDDATPRQVAEAVRIGPFLMPSFSQHDLSPAQLDKLIAYVEYTKRPDDRGGLGLGHIGPVPEGIVPWLVVGIVLVGLCVLLGERLHPRGGRD